MPSAMESWDDDGDLQGDLFGMNNAPTLHLNNTHNLPPLTTTAHHNPGSAYSSRVSVRSESNIADEDWQMLIAPNDPLSKTHAISTAAQVVGIPIPENVPSTALLGGSIKRLGKKKSKKDVSDDWGDDFDMPDAGDGNNNGPPILKLKQVNLGEGSRTPAMGSSLDQDDFDTEWAEGSLGFRTAGKTRDTRGRSSSVSAMSPSMGSCNTMEGESEEDDLGGLVLPSEPIDFGDRLKKRKAQDYDGPSPVLPSAPAVQSLDSNQQRSGGMRQNDDDDMMTGLDFGGEGNFLDNKKRRINRNVKVKQSIKPSTPAARTGTSLTFTDKPVQGSSSLSKIPRPTPSTPVTISKQFRLDTVPEGTGQVAATAAKFNRLARAPTQTTTSAQLLRSKRSAPALGAKPPSGPRPPVPFLPAGIPSTQSHHITAKGTTSHFRNTSDTYERPGSTQPHGNNNENTPSRTGFRRDGPSASLLRQVASQRTLQVTKRKTFGDGSELDRFDDLPTSVAKESKFVKEPTNRERTTAGPYGSKTLRTMGSRRNLQGGLTSITPPVPPSVSSASSTVPSTPLAAGPPTPTTATGHGYFRHHSNTSSSNLHYHANTSSTTLNSIQDSTPRFARDTAASRNAREQRLRPKTGGPVDPAPAINWKAQIAARSPQTSPSAQRIKRRTEGGKRPFLIKGMGGAGVKEVEGMTYNPNLQRWEGNEHALTKFENPSTATLPATGTQYENAAEHGKHLRTNSIPNTLHHINSSITSPSFYEAPNAAATTGNLSQFTNAAAAATAALAPRDLNIIPPARHGSPPRPALISQINNVRGVVVERGMVFDPQRMTWLKLDRRSLETHNLDPLALGTNSQQHGPGSIVSISVEEEEDVFAGMEDLPDERTKVAVGSGAADKENLGSSAGEGAGGSEVWAVGEEFDLGPAFVRRQRAEEQEWRRRVERWMVGVEKEEERRRGGEAWKWEIRRVVASGGGAV